MESAPAPTVTDRKQRLAEIRERASQAITGPWGWTGNTEVDRVELSSLTSGLPTILSVDIRTKEHVFNHVECESYSVEEARERYLCDPDLFPEHPYFKLSPEQLKALAKKRELVVSSEADEDDLLELLIGWDIDHGLDRGAGEETNWDAKRAEQEQLRSFLSIEPMFEEEGPRHLDRDGYAWLTRSVSIRPDLSFASEGFLRSYHDLARYEVLAGRTVEEHKEAGEVVDGSPRNLYREDIVGIATPEAEFIANSRSDIDFLLDEVERLEAELAEERG